MKRRTIAKITSRQGISLHSGNISKITFIPSNHKKGILFYNTLRDPYKIQPLPISPFIVSNTVFATVIGDSISIKTVEHILSALAALSITDLIIEIDGDEPPVLDGSAYNFLEMLREAGCVETDEEIEPLRIEYPIWIIDGDKYIFAVPANEYAITYSIDFSQKSTVLKSQAAHFKITEQVYAQEIARARTFGFAEDIEWLKKNNLALGGSFENALIYSKEGLLNEEIRFSDEAVRHKILDLIGDMYLLGKPIQGHIIAHKAGHTLDTVFAKKLYWHEHYKASGQKVDTIIKEFKNLSQQLQIPVM